MAIYEKPVHLLMKDMVKNLKLEKGQPIKREQVLAWFRANYPKIKPGTVTAHLTRLSTNAPSRTHYNAKASGEDDLFYQMDGNTYRLYEPDRDPSPIYERTTTSTSRLITEETIDEEGYNESGLPSEFAYERDLKNFLAKNLGLLERGLKLYEDEDIRGIEFPVGGRFIDILAVDEANNLVVIELKVSRGYDRVIGQLQRYMGWIEQNLAETSQKVRGMIVAREISGDLLLAASKSIDVELFEYELSVSLQKVGSSKNHILQG